MQNGVNTPESRKAKGFPLENEERWGGLGDFTTNERFGSVTDRIEAV
jgi:hypothetical protein